MSINSITEGYEKNLAMMIREFNKNQPSLYGMAQKKQFNSSSNTASMDNVQISQEAMDAYKGRPTGLDGAEMKTGSSVSTMAVYNDFNRALAALSSKEMDAIGSSNYSEEKVAELSKHFASEEGTKTDTFSQYANKMAAVYQMMSDTIDEKYADPNRKEEYYFADDGSLQLLTKEKEKAMLDRVYRNQSEFMASSTEIWNTIDSTEFYEIYGKGQGKQETGNAENTQKKSSIVDSQKGEIKNAAFQAFMSAISTDNKIKLFGAEGSWNHVKLDFGISESQTSSLNKIWDYYANKKQA